jgi:hypothetical protein
MRVVFNIRKARDATHGICIDNKVLPQSALGA